MVKRLLLNNNKNISDENNEDLNLKNLQYTCKKQALTYQKDMLVNNMPNHYTSHWNTKYNKCFAEFIFIYSNNF